MQLKGVFHVSAPYYSSFLNYLARYERNGKKLSIHQKLNLVYNLNGQISQLVCCILLFFFSVNNKNAFLSKAYHQGDTYITEAFEIDRKLILFPFHLDMNFMLSNLDLQI